MGRRVDTTVILRILSRPQRHAPRELLGAQIDITFITLGELTRWATLRQWGPTRRAELEGWLATRPALPCTDAVARLWGEISRMWTAAFLRTTRAPCGHGCDGVCPDRQAERGRTRVRGPGRLDW